MHICINAAAANRGGSVTYLQSLLHELAGLESDDRYLVVAPEGTLAQLGRVLETPRFDAEPYPHPPAREVRRLIFDQVRVPALARRFGADVLFSANGFATFRSSSRQALLLRNARYFSRLLETRLERLGRPRRGLALRRAWSALSIRSSAGLLFPSRAMQGMVERHVSLAGKPRAVLHYGFDRERFFSGDRPPEHVLAPIEAWRERRRQVLLFVSGYSTHKNFETAVEGLAALLRDGVDVGLVLTASRVDLGDMELDFDRMIRRIRELGIEDNVHVTGDVAWSGLHGLYAAADAFLFPSFLESFGHPMVEAMASGLPSVAADTAVNREILGEAAVFFDTFDPMACARSVREVIGDADRAAGLRQAARQRAEHFSWRTHAERLRGFFGELASSEPR